jgi:hypothetical protein
LIDLFPYVFAAGYLIGIWVGWLPDHTGRAGRIWRFSGIVAGLPGSICHSKVYLLVAGPLPLVPPFSSPKPDYLLVRVKGLYRCVSPDPGQS